MIGFLEWPRVAVVAACLAVALLPPLLMGTLASFGPGKRVAKSFMGAEPAIIGTVSLLFGLFAAFLANDIWTRNQIARQAVIEEADALRNLARLAEGQEKQNTLIVRTALADYAKTVIALDWPAMERGVHSSGLLSKVRAISSLIVSGPVGRASGPVVQSKMLDVFVTLREKRQVRTIMAENRTFTIKWHALMLFALLTQFAITVTHLGRPRPMLLAHMVFGLALATCLSILVLNEFPFSRLNPISPQPLQTAMESLYRN